MTHATPPRVKVGNESASAQPRAYLWVTAALSLLALHAWLLKNGADLQVFELAGRRALHGEPLYRLEEAMPFKYTPIAALLFHSMALPLALLIPFCLWSRVADSGRG